MSAGKIPFFSIIVPTFRRPDALRRLLVSLAKQDLSLNDFEIIVVENSAEGSAIPIVQDMQRYFQEHLVYLIEKRPGAHHARNAAARIAKGKFLLFMDDDCEATPTLLTEYRHGLSRLGVPFAGGRIDIKWDDEPPPYIRPFEALLGKVCLAPEDTILPAGTCVNGGNMAIRRDVFAKLGGMEPDQVGRYISGSGDVGLCRRAQDAGYDIGWVAKAQAFHWQSVSRNATRRDLFRRQVNNGICAAYEDLRNGTIFAILKKILRRALCVLMRTATIFTRFGKLRGQLDRIAFETAFDLGYIWFCSKTLIREGFDGRG